MNVHEAVERRLQAVRVSKRFNPQKLHDDLEPVFAENGFREPLERIENILIIRLDVMGDLILTSGVFREVRRNYPEAHIAAVVSEPNLPLMEVCPYCDELFTFDRWSLHNNLTECFERMEGLCETYLRPRRYDLCLLPQWGDDRRTSMLLAYLSGARERIGYSETSMEAYIDREYLDIDTSFETAFLTRAIVNPPEIIHEVARHFYLVKALGMAVRDSATEIWMSEEDMESASALLLSRVPEGCIVVALGIGAGGASRKYPIKKYLTAIRAILERYEADIRFVIIGGKAEKEDGAYLAANLPEGAAINLVGKTTLRESFAIISLASLYLGNDTGIMHAAAAAETPIIALYREAEDKERIAPGILGEYARFSPWRVRAEILRPKHALGACANAMTYGGCEAEVPHCITQITPEEIVAAFDRISGLPKREKA